MTLPPIAARVSAVQGLYPAIEPFDAGLLQVSQRHRIYYEQSGRPDGPAALFLHGGPGGGCQPWCRRLFDPDHYRAVLLDQRGCGRSLPNASLLENTTWDLVADLERLREHLGIERWLVLGGSWGSTLALAYAERHPERVVGLILRGVFLATRREYDWFYQRGTRELFPEAWEAFITPIPEEERDDLLTAYHKRIVGEDRDLRVTCALAWTRWEFATARLVPDAASDQVSPEFALAFAGIETHYFVHDAWLKPDQLLSEVGRIRHLPGVIIQGRYDVICPARNAWRLHRAWPRSRLEIVPASGHSALEPAILQRLLAATDGFRDAG